MKIKLRKLTFISLNILILLPLVIHADIYVATDQQGVTHFSDMPEPGAEFVPITEAQSYSSPAFPIVDKSVIKPNIKPIYKSLTIVKPVDQETIDNNRHGDILVKVAAQPALKNGDKLRLIMDGQVVFTQKKTIYKLKNIERGSHMLQVQIINAQGKVLIESSSVTFYVQRSKGRKH